MGRSASLLLALVVALPSPSEGAGPPTLGACGCYRLDGLWWVALHKDGVWTASTAEGWHWAGRWRRQDGGLWVVESRVGEPSRRHVYALGWERLKRALGPFPP